MGQEIRLAPEELYFIASLMKAQYIDYTYVAAMQDIEQHYALYKRETQANLVAKGLLDEDFSGNIEILPIARELLTPIFFGEFESSVDICYVQEGQRRVELNRFHYGPGTVTHVQSEEAELLIRRVEAAQVRSFVEGLLSQEYAAETSEMEYPLQAADISRVLAIKSLEIGKKKIVKVFVEANGIMCYEKSDDSFIQMSRNDFVDDVLSIIRRA